jgi:Ca-activated chloride channel homolog
VLFLAASVPAQDLPQPAEPATLGPRLSVGIVVDNSGSYRLFLDRVVNSTVSIIGGLGAGDEGFLVTFVDAPKIVLRQEMTTKADELKDAAENMFIEGGQTSILDSVVFAARYMTENAAAGSSRVIVLVTDGDERSSSATVDEAVKAAKDAKAKVMVLGLYDEKFYPKVIDKLVRETGGEKFPARTAKEASSAVAALIARLGAK